MGIDARRVQALSFYPHAGIQRRFDGMNAKTIFAVLGIILAVLAVALAHPYLLPAGVVFIGIAVIVP